MLEEDPFEHTLDERPEPDGIIRWHAGYSSAAAMHTLKDFIMRDKQREKDGFKRKMRLAKYTRPAKKGKGILVVPTVEQDKFYHRRNPPSDGDLGQGTGTGPEGEGQVIGRRRPGEGQDCQDGQAGEEEGEHGMELDPQELGRLITEQFSLPNLKQKGRKRSLTTYRYELNALNRGAGQLLDRKRTLNEIIKRNLALGRIDDITDIDMSRLIISPQDYIYRVLTPERARESEATVFFARDYSGSMDGLRTTMLVGQHVMIYCWLSYQYKGRVKTRFVLHDTSAKEVPTFHEYSQLNAGGGTKVSSAYTLINRIIDQENLAKDSNIYVFHGTDGDDWGDGTDAIKELTRMMDSTNLIGVTLTNEGSYQTQVEQYLRASGLPNREGFRLSKISDIADEEIFRSMRELLS